MSLDLFQQEANDRLTALPPVQNVEPAMFDGFIRGTGLATMKGLAKTGRAIDLLGSVAPIIQDTFTGGTEAQDKYFKEHDEIYGRAVDYWTPKTNEIGSAAEIMGSLLSVIPFVAFPATQPLAIATTQLGTAQDLVNAGVSAGTANVVGAVQGATLATGIWMPILGKNLWQRTLIGGAGFNAAQGIVARSVSGAILEDTPAKDMFKAFDAEALTLDVLLGLAFGSLVHLSPTQRAQGADAWNKIESWAKNLSPSDKAAISVLREAQHLNVDSTPGKPVDAPTIEAHVQRMRAAIDQLAKDQPVQIEDITIPRTTIPIEEAPPQVRELFEREQQLREEFTDATASRDEALGRNDQEAAAQWAKELERIGTELQDVSTSRTELWDPERPAEQPRYEPDPERGAETEAMAAAFREDAKVVMAEEGLAPPPQEPPRVTQSVRRTIEEQLTTAGRPAEEASAGAALWDAFYTTMAKRIGMTVDQLWNQFPLTRITREAPDEGALKALKQGPDGEPVLNVDGKDRPITNADGRRIAEDIQELKNFWNWFKDSKLTKDGKPITLYHGTKSDFSQFKQGRAQKFDSGWFGSNGIYLSGSTDLASAYALREPGGAMTQRPSNVMPVYVRMENPFRVDMSAMSYDQASNFTKQYGGDEAFTKWLKDNGYDGVIGYRDPDIAGKGAENWEVVVFDPTQIKSAIGNRGTFDPKNPDILYQDKRDTWYKSALGEAITKLNMKAAPAKGWLDALKGMVGKNNVKADEIKWSGIEEWLQMQAEPVPVYEKGYGIVEERRYGDGDWEQVDDLAMYSRTAEEAQAKITPEFEERSRALMDPRDRREADVRFVVKEYDGLDFGKTVTPKITKEQVQDFLANNGVKVEEVMTGGKTTPNLSDPQIAQEMQTLKDAGWLVDQDPDGGRMIGFADPEGDILDATDLRALVRDDPTLDTIAGAAENIEAYWYGMQGETPTKFSQYQLPGGENYRELLLTLPEKKPAEPEMLVEQVAEYNGEPVIRVTYGTHIAEISHNAGFPWRIDFPGGQSVGGFPTKEAAIEAAQQKIKTFSDWGSVEGDGVKFRSSHFDQPNILAHIRFNERTDADGKKVLFIEELQSDWAQQGKRLGFAGAPVDTTGWTAKRPADGYPADWEVYNAAGEHIRNVQAMSAESAIQNAAQGGVGRGNKVPSAPFVGKTDAWVALSLKRMIAYAAENGFDRIAWTRGEQQVERYTSALRKAVDVIEWTKTDKGVQLVGYKTKGALHDMMVARDRELGEQTPPRTKVVDTTEKEDALSDAIGKAMAEKIISDPNQTGTIEGDNIRIDSTGMAGFYDRIVPKVAKQVLKDLGGGKVNESILETGSIKRQGVARRDDGTYSIINLDANVGSANEYTGRYDTRQEAEAAMHAATKTEQMAFDITPEMKAKVEGGLPLFQKGQAGARGYMSTGPEGRIIGLLEDANASTFLHESGHFFLDTLNDISRLPDVPAAIREDLDIALKWTGVEDPAKWADMSLDEKRPYHEKWARGFEQYLREGKAPSEKLRGVFQRFRDWLVEIYKSARQLNVKLNDDIRGVMNRMLADQVRNPSTEAPLAPVERPGSPPPPRAGEEAPAEPTGKDNPAVRQILEVMAAEETGWAQEGGKLLDQGELGTGKPSFTTWIPKAEWWPERPDKKLNATKVQEAVRKYLAGEKLKPAEQRTVDYMLKVAEDRNRGIDTVGGEDEYQALARDADLEGLDYTTENIVDLDLVARAAAIDEAIVERAAMMYPNDDAAFRGELEMAIYEHETQQAAEAAGRSKAREPAQGTEQDPDQSAKLADIVRNEAELIVDKNPDMPINMGTDAAGNPITMTAREFLDQARAEADLNRRDIPLLEVAAQCLLGKF